MFRLFLFGSPVLLTNNQEPIQIRRKRSMALLAYLAMQKRPQSREALATLLWPDYDQSKAFANLRRELARLKADTGEGFLYIDRQTIGIDPEADLWVDVLAFMAGSENKDPTSLAETIELYTDHFMVGLTIPDSPPFDEWQFFQTESLRATYSTTLQRFLEIQIQAQDYQGAVETARRWLLLDTLHEPAHRSLMRCYALSGQYAAAVRQYHICAQTLETELGIEPEQETKALLAAIEAKKIAPIQKPQVESEPVVLQPSPKSAIIRHNLPAFPDSFIGRQRIIEEITHHLTQTDGRLLTLRGLGGIGKTRLAIQAMTTLIDSDYFPDGLIFVNLAAVESDDFIIPAIAETLNFPLSTAKTPLEQLSTFIQEKKLLLLLDNFEHLQSGAAQLAVLLRQCPNLKLLITSRHQLNLAGESILVLDGLQLAQSPKGKSEAVQLFQDRASQFVPTLDFAAEQIFIEAICRLVDGLPLAIEMCAAWVHTLSCQEILAEIQQGLSLLESGRLDVPQRHQSIRAVFLSSYQLLNPAEQQALLTLAIFQGGFSREAAEQVAGAKIFQLRSLVEKSLLSARGQPAETRYHMHQLLRQFALEKITAENLENGRKRHARYFANLLAQLDKLRLTPENEKIITTIFIEMDNLRSIWRWLGRQIEARQVPELVSELIEKLLPAWNFAYSYKTYYLEGKQLLGLVWKPMNEAGWEQAASDRQQRTFACVSAILGRSCLELGQFEEAIAHSQSALSILKRLNANSTIPAEEQQTNAEYISFALRTWGVANYRIGDLEQSEQHLTEALEIAPTKNTKAWARQSLGTLLSNVGRYEEALTYTIQALPVFEATHDQVGSLAANIAIGSIYGRQRLFEEAIPRYREVARLARRLEQKGLLMIALSNLAICLNKIGQNRQVADFFEEALSLARETGNKRWQAMIAQDFGFALLERGDVQQAETNIRDGLQLAAELKSQPDVLAGLLPMAHLQAHNGHFENALIAVGFMMNNEKTNEESKQYAADLWEELSTELPPIFTQRAQAKLENATLDDILAMMPH